MTETTDWAALLDSWDRQQQGYIPRREHLISTMLEATEAVVGDAPRVLDLGCGPGTISARLLQRCPQAHVVAVDIDPVLLAIGRGALGDMDGHLQWVVADLRSDSWTEAIGTEPFDAVLSATALHWLTPEQLLRTYHRIATVLRHRGLLLNADRLDFDQRSPTCRQLSAALTGARWQEAFADDKLDDWQTWWGTLAGQPDLDPLLEARRQRFTDNNHATQQPGTITSYALHTGALAEAGFAEVDTIWQDLNRRVLLAINTSNGS